ncbi:hypothetical protein TVAG_187160 [Trichomonas vaginalis G3]|uniref:Importin N-terminal domain-containing protein n=1 Tax=Trichomonas vaginalis (strain ATCC PRA-98 / G3) TaxID=412133 RepID=A2FVV5_TRIV3|nr:armadillo (ARM) repeat-containing protein family [Trichomonas vaginalis G3]EAX90967.1 hypothetical protein TVAG_187160 [Trichomonas vaginalis G3]KAI5490852.1 armadillo (ARM) repeat-containing protein family [Trichomonas vaginalis G3]|eukprot:XP_001303897.1 hypothetical protein [Trichomonas vaginalis G3]
MEELFQDFLSEDEGIKNKAISSLLQFITQSDAFDVLLSFLLQHLNDQFTNVICIVIKEAIKTRFNLLDSQDKQVISDKLIEISFEIADHSISYIMSCLEMIFADKLIDISYVFNKSIEYLQKKEKIIQSLLNLTNYLLIFGCQKSFYTKENEEIILILMQITESLLSDVQITNMNEASSNIIYLSANLLIDLWRSRAIFTSENFFRIIQFYLTFLSEVSLKSDVITSILTFFLEYIDRFLNIKSEFSEFASSFQETYAVELLERLLRILQSGDSYQRSISIRIISIYIQNDVLIDNIINEEVLSAYIIPSLQLTDEDIQTFKNIPEQYLSFCTSQSHDSFKAIVTPRQAFVLFIDSISRKSTNLTYLLLIKEICGQGNFSDEETIYFILSCLSSHLQEDNELILFLINIIQTENELIQCDSLSGLINISEYKEERLQISLNFIKEDYNPCTRLLAANLFQVTFDPQSDIDISDLQTIIAPLLDLSSVVSNSLPGIILCSLNRWFKDEFSQMAEAIVNSYLIAFAPNSDNQSGTIILEGISSILESLDPTTDEFYSIAGTVIEFVGEQFNSEGSACNLELLNLLSTISERSLEINDLLISALNIILSIEDKSSFSNGILKFISIIVMKKEITSYSVLPDIIKAVYEIADGEEYFEAKAAPIFVLCGILQIWKNNVLQIVKDCMQYIESENDSLFFASFSVLASAICYCDQFSLPDDLLQYFVSSYTRYSHCEPSIGLLYCYALSKLAVSQKNTEISNIAVETTKRMKFLQECYENYEELDIDECEDYLELPFHNLTSDSLTYSSALQPILENSEMRSSINDQDFIEKLTHS